MGHFIKHVRGSLLKYNYNLSVFYLGGNTLKCKLSVKKIVIACEHFKMSLDLHKTRPILLSN